MLLGGLNGVVQGIASLRNAEGTGHGHLKETRLIRTVAHLGVNAAIALCTFLVDYAQSQGVNSTDRTSSVIPPQVPLGYCPRCHDEIQLDANYCEECRLPIVYLVTYRS